MREGAGEHGLSQTGRRENKKKHKMQSIVFFGVLDSDSGREKGTKKNKIVMLAQNIQLKNVK